MQLRPFVAAVALCVASAASAQQLAHDTYSIRSAPRIGGAYDITTGRFLGKTHGGVLSSNLQTVYNNTCIWSGGGFYAGVDACEDDYDEGRVPLTANGGAGFNGLDNSIDSFEIAYCTRYPFGFVDVDIEVFDTGQLGGACVGNTPPIGAVGVAQFDSAAAGFPLPGSTTLGIATCWIVTLAQTTPFCLSNGPTTGDLFNWRIRFNQQFAPTSPDGPVIAGDPSVPPGSGTYNIGGACGHGLGTADSFWANYDNVPVGQASTTGCGPTFPGSGTNCYWFNGYPTNPFASFWFRMTSRGPCQGIQSSTPYCTAKTNSNACAPVLQLTGPFALGVSNAFLGLQGNVSVTSLSPRPGASAHLGQLFYSTTGASGAAFQGGHLCVKNPIKRIAPLVNTGGTVGSTTLCDSSVTQDFNARIKSGIDPALTAGANVWIQGWARDTAPFQGVQLSGARQFVVAP